MLRVVSRVRATAFALAALLLMVSVVRADPPVPGPTGTTCATVQCMRVTGITEGDQVRPHAPEGVR